MNKAAFSIKDYQFPKVKIDLAYLNDDNDEGLNVQFNPHGTFNKAKKIYELTFEFEAKSGKTAENPFVAITCVGLFEFDDAESLDDIPKFFYRNSIAILFPYLRAYISLVTNQANIPPFILPTLNLSALEQPLKENSSEI